MKATVQTSAGYGEAAWAYLQLMRPANVITAWADILAGALIASAGLAVMPGAGLGWLLLSTTGLYSGGVVWNDALDAQLDARERPERPIPQGKVSQIQAAVFGTGLLLLGVGSAAQVSAVSGAIAFGIAVLALVYDGLAKHQAGWGPLVMGSCRGLNLLLGLSLLPDGLGDRAVLALIPLLYIAAITLLSTGEVQGGQHSTSLLSLALLGGAIAGALSLSLLPDFHLWWALPFLGIWIGAILPPWIQSVQTPHAEILRRAVKTGVLSLIVLDAALAAGFAGSSSGLILVSLLPLSLGCARLFAVT